MKTQATTTLAIVFLGLGLAACNGGADAGGPPVASIPGAPFEPGAGHGGNPEPRPTPTEVPSRSFAVDALLFVGSGTWSPEVASLKNILMSHGATYHTATSAQLSAMPLDQLDDYGTLIFPGGTGATQANSLTSAARARLREVVQKRGVSYVGFCAGAFIAQAPAPKPGGDVSYGLGIVDGPELEYYYLEYQGVTARMTTETFADGSKKSLLWYGGPVTPDGKGVVVAKYPNGDPAISQLRSGAGLVVISGPHPTATSSMISSLGLSGETNQDVAWDMIHAAVSGEELATF